MVPFSSAMINKVSVSIISEEWDHSLFSVTERVVSGGFPALFQDVAFVKISPE